MKSAERRKLLFLSLAIVVAVWGEWICLPSQADCGPKGDKGNEGSALAGKKKRTDKGSMKRSFRMEEIEIHGDVEKPKTMFVIPRASLRYSRKDHHKDFTKEILYPVSKQWVEDTQRWREAIPAP
jgi:hypothetical protein